MSPALTYRVEQIRQRWWVVVLATAVALLAASLASLTAHPAYVGKSSLVLTSPGRWSEQDIQMVIGYTTLFNDPATIDRLRATKTIPEDVTLEARPVAASPILTIEATADDPAVAQEAATSAAEAFRDDINSAARTATDDAVADLERKFSDLMQRFPDATGGLASELESSLQDQIYALRTDLTNQLHDLQRQAGVTKIAPPLVFNLVQGVAGGLLLGILAALGMAAMSTRIMNSTDLRKKTGIEPLVEVPRPRSVRKSTLREDRIRKLANIVGSQDSPGSVVIALTDGRGGRGAGAIAEALAIVLAQQEYRTVLVYADNEVSHAAEDAGFNDELRDTKPVHQMLEDGGVQSLKVLPRRRFFANRHSPVSTERISAVLDEIRAGADIIVVAAPSIADSTHAQPICAAADFTVLVVDTRSARAGDVTSAVEVLGRARAAVLGVVLVHGNMRATETAGHESRHPDTAARSPHR